MSNPSVKLTASELDRALKYVVAAGASDFFPQPFEIHALEHSWTKVRSALTAVDLLTYEPQACVELIAPKQRLLVRPVHLLDPIDCLFYTALTMRVAASIESQRQQYQEHRVFSYHYRPNDMAINTFASYWDEYQQEQRTLCAKYRFVGTADIVDFFPRVYLHRLENSILELSHDEYATRAIMRLVGTWAHGTSYGLPVGPHASNYLAEALLVEVDDYLLSCDVEFVRWIDDYTVFGNTESDIVRGVTLLGTRLQPQGLSLNPAKTRLRLAREHKAAVIDNPGPISDLEQRIFKEVFGGNPYADIDYDDLPERARELVDSVDAKKLLDDALSGDIVDLKAVKVVLTFLGALRRPDLSAIVVENLPRLLPLARNVARFFEALGMVEEAIHPGIGRTLLRHLTSGQFVPDYQAMWLLTPFGATSKWNNVVELRKLARESNSRMVRRQAILGLRESGSRSALLDAKNALDERSDWERRAILYACSKLPKDEYKAVVSHAGGTAGTWTVADCLTKAVLEFGKAGQ